MVGQTGFFSLGKATSLGEGKLWIQLYKSVAQSAGAVEHTDCISAEG